MTTIQDRIDEIENGGTHIGDNAFGGATRGDYDNVKSVKISVM